MLGKARREEIVEEFLNDRLIVKYGFDPIDISVGIDWEHTHQHNSRTYAVYLHALEYVGYLALAGKDFEDEKYFDYAMKTLENWIEIDKEKEIKHSWNEHSVSYRLSNFILFQETVPEKYKIDRENFDNLIIKHCAFLADEENYRPNNHGILMDESLFKASFYISNRVIGDLYRNLALNRVKLALYRDFSRKGLHSENSPEYHRMMMIVLTRFNKLIQEKGSKLTNDMNHKLKKARSIQRIILKPDSTYPMIGDTSLIKEKNFKKDFSDFVDYEAGLAVFQYENEEEKSSSDYLYFKCGYLSKTHKHHDDLSINLMLDGNDIFIDSGKYNYNKKDPIRNYVISPDAHTVPMIEGKTYHPTSPIVDQYNLGISNVTINKEYKIVRGYNTLYEGCQLNRTVVLAKDGYVFILDEIESENEEVLIQNFNINEKAIIEILENNDVEIEVNENKYIMSVVENQNVDVKKLQGYYSHTFSKYKENTHIRFINSLGKNTSLITIYNQNKMVENVTFSNNQIVYFIKGKKNIIIL